MYEPNDASPDAPGDDPNSVWASFECERVAGPWHVRHAAVREAVSRPYRIDVSLVTESLDIDTDQLVGSGCEFAFEHLTEHRIFRGVVARVHHRGRTTVQGSTPLLAVDLEVVPALAMLGQRVNCRIFQDMTVPEILQDVLMGEQVPVGEAPEGLAAYQRTVNADSLHQPHYAPPRDYCIQYKESDLDFVSRLMHEEGIVYLLSNGGEEHEVLRLLDDEGSLPELTSESGAQVPVSMRQSEGRACIKQFSHERAASPTRVSVRHHDWLDPLQPVHHPGMVFTQGEVASNDREIFIPRERRVRETYDGVELQALHDDSERELALVMERLMSDDYVGRGSSNVITMAAGSVFELDRETESPRLVALEVVHEISVTEQALGGPAHYENHFVCVPSYRFRAATAGAPRPVMHGPQTATVTGPPGEEIHTDAHGRIKILMHWDREGEGRGRERRDDALSSVWVRVLQAWAGPGFGFMFLPRVGMEVVVEFLDGNPDRPVVVGCLYNGRNRPPYGLPEQKTKSTIRTSSSPGDGGFNELRFEDAAAQEEVYLHAQRDLNEVVRRNHETEVGEDQDHRVGHDRTRTVGGNEHVTIDGSRHITVRGRSEQGPSGQTVKVTHDYSLDVARRITVEAPVEIVIKCEGSSITMSPNSITLQAGAGAKLVLDADGLLQSKLGSLTKLDANVQVRAHAGGELQLEGKAVLTAGDQAQLQLDADALLRSAGDAHARLEDTKVTVSSGDATITVDGPHAVLDGDKIDVMGATKVTLEGGGARTALAGGNAGLN